MIGDRSTDYGYKGRVYRNKAMEKQIHEDIRTMVSSLMMSGKRRLRIEEARDVVMGDGSNIEYYDAYSGCKSHLKKYCPASNMKWAGYIDVWDEDDKEWHRPYRVLAESELGVYLKVLDLFMGKKVQFPAVL